MTLARRWSVLTIARLSLVLALVASQWVVLVPPASAHWSAGLYTYKGGSCTASNRVDPVTVMFHNYATGARVLNHVQHHGGWTHTSGTTQHFLTHSQCYTMTGQRANGGTLSSRWHIRVRTTYHSDATWGTTAMGSPHRDNLTWCGHAVPSDGFNTGRSTTVNLLSPHSDHSVTRYTNWGNTQSMKQCNGGTAASNGQVAWISMPSWNH